MPDMMDIEYALIRIAKSLETIAAIEKRKDNAAQEALELTKDYKSQRLSFIGPQECIYCERRNVHLILRGTIIFGCVDCIDSYIRTIEKKP
jgi:hypothetical protein